MNKILVIDLHCDALLPSGLGEFGGGNTYSKAVISAISNTDIDCLYITRKKIKSLPTEENISSNITYIRIEVAQDEVEDKDTLYIYSDEILEKILNITKELQFIPSLIHSIYWPSGIVALKLSDYFKVPFIHTILSNGKRKLLQSGNYEIADIRIKYEEACFQNAKHIICSSLYELKDVSTLYNIPTQKLILTGLEVDSAFLNPSYSPSGTYKLHSSNSNNAFYVSIDKSSHTNPSLWWNKGAFLFFGRLHQDKGIIQIINSWIELKKQYPMLPMLWIAGGSPEQIHKLRKLVADISTLEHYELSQEIIWWGRLSAEGLSTLMLKTLALVTHSRYESGGLMVLEAMAHGIPVIATPHGYANDYIKNWENGFIVPFNDCVLLKRRMLHFMYQPFLSSLMGTQANLKYKEVTKEFNFANKHTKLYNQQAIEKIVVANNKNIYRNNLPYPLAEYIPTDDEVLSFFFQYMHNNTWNHHGTPCLIKTENFERYIIWTIEYNNQLYQCFRWKTHINSKRIFVDEYEYFYTCEELTLTDKLLYDSNICYAPINRFLEYNIIIHPLSHLKNAPSIKESVNALFYNLQIRQNVSHTINFHKLVKESKTMLENYNYNIEDISLKTYRFLENIHLDDENELGLVPEFLINHSVINNHFVHLGSLCIGSQSYFYAQYLLMKNIIHLESIQFFFEENNILKTLYLNTCFWILNLQFHKAVQLIIYNNDLQIEVTRQIEDLLRALE